MQREWNPKSFFRHLTPEVINLFIHSVGVSLALDPKLPPGLGLYAAWKSLPTDQQTRLETELLPVNDMCSPHARPYLEAAARRSWTNGRSGLLEESRDWSAQDLALRLYLDDRRAFFDAYKDYSVDAMEHGKEYRGRGPVKVKPSHAAKRRMEAEIQQHFRETAFGARCQVEDHANEEKFALFVYHEDEVTPLERFTSEGTVTTDWQRPVLRIAAVFHFDSATLQVKASRRAEREKLRDLFAQVYVGEPDYFTNETVPKFCFDVLRREDFRFPTLPIDKVDEVSVVKVVTRPAGEDVRRVIVELEPGLSMHGVHTVLGDHGIDVMSEIIDGVQLRFMFEGRGRSRFRTVSVFNPNSTNLRDTARDRVIRRYLRQWGIDGNLRKTVAAPALEAAAG